MVKNIIGVVVFSLCVFGVGLCMMYAAAAESDIHYNKQVAYQEYVERESLKWERLNLAICINTMILEEY